MNPDLFWIPGPWTGGLAVATRPRGGDWLEDELAGWRNSGVRLIVSLLEPKEAEQLQLDSESEAAASAGIEFISFPIPDRDVPTSLPALLTLLKNIGEALEDGKNVAVHCRQGIGRSGLIAALVLMSSGMETGKAAETVSAARGVTVPETAEQRGWLQNFQVRDPAVKAS